MKKAGKSFKANLLYIVRLQFHHVFHGKGFKNFTILFIGRVQFYHFLIFFDNKELSSSKREFQFQLFSFFFADLNLATQF